MARFSEISRGTLARHVEELPMANGNVERVAVRPLLDCDDDEIETNALAYAKARGAVDPKAGNPLYDRGIALHTLLIACSDPDSPDDAPRPFFDSVEQIQRGLDRDRIAWLIAAQQVWEDKCSPRQLSMTANEFIAHVMEVAVSEDERPFLRLRPGLQWILLRTLARQHVASLEPSLLSGSDSGSTSSSTSSVSS
jgi:hypothetical protein